MRGGKREGAGRKPGKKKTVTVTVRLAPEISQRLRAHPLSMPVQIEKALILFWGKP